MAEPAGACSNKAHDPSLSMNGWMRGKSQCLDQEVGVCRHNMRWSVQDWSQQLIWNLPGIQGRKIQGLLQTVDTKTFPEHYGQASCIGTLCLSMPASGNSWLYKIFCKSNCNCIPRQTTSSETDSQYLSIKISLKKCTFIFHLSFVTLTPNSFSPRKGIISNDLYQDLSSPW